MPIITREILEAVSRELRARERYHLENGRELAVGSEGQWTVCLEAARERSYERKVEEWLNGASLAFNEELRRRIIQRLETSERDLWIVGAILGESVEVYYEKAMP
jgi:hypothetical protein